MRHRHQHRHRLQNQRGIRYLHLRSALIRAIDIGYLLSAICYQAYQAYHPLRSKSGRPPPALSLRRSRSRGVKRCETLSGCNQCPGFEKQRRTSDMLGRFRWESRVGRAYSISDIDTVSDSWFSMEQSVPKSCQKRAKSVTSDCMGP
jgi:hypothetical protein